MDRGVVGHAPLNPAILQAFAGVRASEISGDQRTPKSERSPSFFHASVDVDALTRDAQITRRAVPAAGNHVAAAVGGLPALDVLIAASLWHTRERHAFAGDARFVGRARRAHDELAAFVASLAALDALIRAGLGRAGGRATLAVVARLTGWAHAA